MAQTPDPSEEDDYFLLAMYTPEKVSKCVNLLAEDYLKGTKLKVYYIPYILHIRGSDGISQKELKETIPFDKSRISVVIRELIETGLVYNSATGRNSSLHLTDNGMAAFSICKMFMNIVKTEIFNLDPEKEEFYRQKNVQFNKHLDEIIAKYSKS